ncbi:MAG: PKD domain-containing protein [Saprospiraceae bacterium]|nr:PKD domain-containing protein [Saprospiraceae bacterium]
MDFTGGSIPGFSGPNPPQVSFSGAGNYAVAVTAANECGMVTVVDSFIVYSFEAIVLPDVAPLCNSAAGFTLQASPPGGSWSGPGILSNGFFTPSAADLNQQNELIYTINPGTSCEVRDTLFVLVQGSVVDAGADLSLCPNTMPVSLSGSPAGGVWSGDNVSSAGIFNPQTATMTGHTLTYTYTDTATNCVNSDVLTITILGLPSVNLDSIGNICVDVPFSLGPFVNTTGVTTCAWTFGDGNTSTDCTPTYTYDTPGNYTLTLIAGNSFACLDTATVDLEVVTPPNASFLVDMTEGCADLPVTITHTSSLNNYTAYIWSYGAGEPDTLLHPGTITFTQGESDTIYTITLTAVNGCGTATAQQIVTVFPRPQMNFGPDVSNGCTPLEVNFNNISTGNPDTYAWYVNGELVSTDFQLPQQVFLTGNQDSLYTIMLIGTNECGVDTAFQTVLVKPNPVVAFFNTDTLAGCQPFTIRLIDYSTQGVYVSWDLGDGNTAVGDTVIHTYEEAGQYLVQEFVNNGCGFDTTEVSITVLPAPPVSFTHQPFVCVGDTLYFQNTSPAIIGSFWDFGDGTTDSTQTSTFHVYDSIGVYTVSMTGLAVTTGCPATASSQVEVKPLPQPAFALSDSFGCQPFTISPQNNTPGATNFYVWDFGDGATAVGQNVQHTYALAGQYTLNVQVTDVFGCKNSWAYSPIQVYPKPLAGFEVNHTDICQTPTTLLFDNQSVDADAYQWTFGALGASTNENPTLTVTTPGLLSVTLEARSQFGCADTLTRDITVYTTPDLDIVAEPRTGCSPFFVFFENNSTGVNQFAWSFVDGGTSAEASPVHGYAQAGTYDVVIHANADSVCFDSLILQNYITVLPSPEADFEVIPVSDTIATPNGIFRFHDLSVNAIQWFWDFGDGDTSVMQFPTHRYEVNGAYPVTLIVTNELGCMDTLIQDITPAFFGGLFMPNAISPESGEMEERTFLAVGTGLSEFELSVFATNGQLVWHTSALDENGTPTEAWNGNQNNTGPPYHKACTGGRLVPGSEMGASGTA